MFTPSKSSEISPIADIKSFAFFLKASIELLPVIFEVKCSIREPTDIPSIAPTRSPTPSKDPGLICEAASATSTIPSANFFIFSTIPGRLFVTPSAIPPMKFPIIVPILPANCSRTGSPVSKNF